MTAPALVRTRWTDGSFQPGTGLPVITPTGINITDQPTLTAVLTAAGQSGVELLVGPVAGAGVATAPTPADGQVLAWSATLGIYVPVNPSGQGRLAAASNKTAVAITASAAGGVGASVDITGAVITVPPSGGRAVNLRFGWNAQQTVAGLGVALCGFREVGGSGENYTAIRTLPNTITSPTSFFSASGEYDLGVVAVARTFQLVAQLWAPAANSPTISVFNQTTNPSYIRALAE